MTRSSKAVPQSPPENVSRFTFRVSRPKIIGILNITPDSFYDGGRYLEENAWEKFEELTRQGADIIDIGAESSRPGSERISADKELCRLAFLFNKLRATRHAPRVTISIDTAKSQVAREAIRHGASIVNDISGGCHDAQGMRDLLKEFPSVNFVLMHCLGEPKTMQVNPTYKNVVDELCSFFEERLNFFEQSGVSRSRVILDPGIGFGKTLEHNVQILRGIPIFKKRFSLPVLIGASRKSMIGQLLGGLAPQERLEGSLAAALWCAQAGADYLRVHDVAATRRALGVWQALGNGQ